LANIKSLQIRRSVSSSVRRFGGSGGVEFHSYQTGSGLPSGAEGRLDGSLVRQFDGMSDLAESRTMIYNNLEVPERSRGTVRQFDGSSRVEITLRFFVYSLPAGRQVRGTLRKSYFAKSREVLQRSPKHLGLPTEYWRLATADCLLPTADCPLPTAHCPLATG